MNTKMHRRVFLRGLGGAVVAAPFLSSVWERKAKGQQPPTPKRFIAMFTHYGCVTTKFFPAKSHGALAACDLTEQHRAARAVCQQAPHPARHPRDERVGRRATAAGPGTDGDRGTTRT